MAAFLACYVAGCYWTSQVRDDGLGITAGDILMYANLFVSFAVFGHLLSRSFEMFVWA